VQLLDDFRVGFCVPIGKILPGVVAIVELAALAVGGGGGMAQRRKGL
jgi:hypothetical protein